MVVLQIALLFCVGSSIAEDLFSPNVNIITELEKLKNMEERIQKLEDTLSKVLRENEALKTLLQDSQNKMENFQKDNKVNKVAFSAGLLASGEGNTGPINSDQILIYKKVFSNVGNAYDLNTGIFTAPVKGVYYFRFYGHCHGGTTMAISLQKNGVTQCSVFAYKPTFNANGSNGVVLTLEPGDQMYTKLYSNTWVFDDPGSYTSFSGFLIFPL
ncbi:complement component 1, q subcomponent-like 4 like precursor [Danio rerio]|uniref:Cerebellin 5 n=1 Tax=Danio rerio TaxID=7955 RepID=F1QNI1_DANRE|nr:complement component 1, q subcomponent-like 4 like precursor [Danio rerio]|eukprot:XP_017207460.1 complement component 1, q subcomponent-like 4 like [Danio rerio]